MHAPLLQHVSMPKRSRLQQRLQQLSVAVCLSVDWSASLSVALSVCTKIRSIANAAIPVDCSMSKHKYRFSHQDLSPGAHEHFKMCRCSGQQLE